MADPCRTHRAMSPRRERASQRISHDLIVVEAVGVVDVDVVDDGDVEVTIVADVVIVVDVDADTASNMRAMRCPNL